MLFKKQKKTTAGVLIYLKCSKYVRLGTYIAEYAKIKND